MENYWDKIERFLPEVTRPGRYVGNELHVIKKDWKDAAVHFALAFPDVYEIGMSNVGMGILYHILNRYNWIAAERIFSPWVDMESKMREADIPLLSLESRRPISQFDILGISLQYELQYTNVLNLIDLARIPLRASQRGEADPIVLAGGPCAYNPEPLAEFLDAVVLGDGEEVVIEIAEVVRQAKKEKRNRTEILKTISTLNGVYIPSFFREDPDSQDSCKWMVPVSQDVPTEIYGRTLDKLDKENYPTRPLVPMIEVTHDRFSLEIMRGCTRGCRFCIAGMIYRPIRERSVEDLVNQTRSTIANTGYDEVSLVSLSTSDYSCLNELLRLLRQLYKNEGISISFPSLRPDTFTSEIAESAVGLRRSGLTLAPEAGSQRLRDVINKNNTKEDLFRAVDLAYQMGWKKVKLYFMIGLPTETQDDLKAIVDLVGEIVKIGRRYGRKEVHVSLSPFCPKTQTPFQWEYQNDIKTMEEKSYFLKKRMTWDEVQLKWRDPRVSCLEGILSRGDRRLGEVIYRVWENGSRFDAWSEQFDWDRWLKALSDCNLSVDMYTGERKIHDPLPWDHLNKGVSKSYLIQERNRAFSDETTQDCRFNGCKGCGLMEHPECRKIISSGKKEISGEGIPAETHFVGRKIRRIQSDGMKRILRIHYTKGAEIRYTSHLDMVRILTRTLKKAHIPAVMTQGYHVRPKLATGPPLATGYTSRAEYLDLEISQPVVRNFDEVFNRHLPVGLRVSESKMILGKVDSLNGSISLASYRVEVDLPMSTETMVDTISAFMKRNSCRIIRTKKGQEKELDIRPFVEEVTMEDEGLHMSLRLTPQGTVKVEEVIRSILPHYEEVPSLIRVERTGLYIERRGIRLTPMEIE